MSFDFQLTNGSLVIGKDSDLARVTNYSKLVQDIIKAITTEQGSNPFQPQFGSLISQRLIGKNIVGQNMISVLQSSVEEALIMLQKMQKEQSLKQALSPAETLLAIKSVSIQREPKDPTQINVILKVMSGDGNIVTDVFSMRLN